MQVGLVERANASLGIVTEAVRFSCFTGALSLTQDARLKLGNKRVKKSAVGALDGAAAQAVKRGERLGYWFAMAGSTRNVFNTMGMTV